MNCINRVTTMSADECAIIFHKQHDECGVSAALLRNLFFSRFCSVTARLKTVCFACRVLGLSGILLEV